MLLHLGMAPLHLSGTSLLCGQAPEAAGAPPAPTHAPAAQPRVLRPRVKAESKEEEGEEPASSPSASDAAGTRERDGGGSCGSSSSSSDDEGEEEEEGEGEEDEDGGRIDCVCGATDADPRAKEYAGLWVLCDACGAWLHGACIGFPRRGPPGARPAHPPARRHPDPIRTRTMCRPHCASLNAETAEQAAAVCLAHAPPDAPACRGYAAATAATLCGPRAAAALVHACWSPERGAAAHVPALLLRIAGEYECARCAAARTGARVTADCGATLIVCPASILSQWHAEIRRHTQPGGAPRAGPMQPCVGCKQDSQGTPGARITRQLVCHGLSPACCTAMTPTADELIGAACHPSA